MNDWNAWDEQGVEEWYVEDSTEGDAYHWREMVERHGIEVDLDADPEPEPTDDRDWSNGDPDDAHEDFMDEDLGDDDL